MSSLRYSGSPRSYKELAELPVPTSADFVSTTTTSGVSGQRDHPSSAKFLLDYLSLSLQSFASPIQFVIMNGM